MSDNMDKLTFENVDVSYFHKKEETTVLVHVNASFQADMVHVIVGPSGCGKTTLLKTLLDIIDYDGNIYLDGKDIEKIPLKKRLFSYVSQDFGLYPGMNVFDNIAFPLKNLKTPVPEIVERIHSISKLLEIIPCLNRKISELSLGQQQRVALARAMVKKPNVCLLDEPLSNLDEKLKTQALEWMKKAFKEEKTTVLYVTHDIKEALAIGDTITLIDNGTISFSGSKEDFLNSDIPFLLAMKEELRHGDI